MTDTADATHQELQSQIRQKYEELDAVKASLAELQRKAAQQGPEALPDYSFETQAGSVKLSELFGDKDDLIVIHNKGRSCPYCTLWADGFVGLDKHLNDRASFVLASPDSPEVQAEFAASRGWPFRMVSVSESSFTKDMGYQNDEGHYGPGYSTFRRKEDGSIARVGADWFGPGDQYCGLWPMLQMLENGQDDWQPKYEY